MLQELQILRGNINLDNQRLDHKETLEGDNKFCYNFIMYRLVRGVNIGGVFREWWFLFGLKHRTVELGFNKIRSIGNRSQSRPESQTKKFID